MARRTWEEIWFTDSFPCFSVKCFQRNYIIRVRNNGEIETQSSEDDTLNNGVHFNYSIAVIPQ